MPTNPTKRVPTYVLDNDRLTVTSLQFLPDYSPRNPAYATAELQQLVVALTQAEEAEVLAEHALAAARERAIAAGVALHDGAVGAKREVVTQYGPDSPSVNVVGLTPLSERKRPIRREKVEA